MIEILFLMAFVSGILQQKPHHLFSEQVQRISIGLLEFYFALIEKIGSFRISSLFGVGAQQFNQDKDDLQ